jgi:hypothetical protein
MKIKRPLAPAFVNRLDEYLLLNKPDTWSTRAHLVVYYGLLFLIALTAICFLAPTDARERTTVYIWIVLVSILSLIGFIIWMIYLLRFNVFKRFGIVTMGDRLKHFMLYFLCVGVMVLAAYVPPYVETVRANQQWDQREITEDMNYMNLSICNLAYDSLPRKWRRELVVVRDTIDRRSTYPGVATADEPVAAIDTSVAYDEDAPYRRKDSTFLLIDTAELRGKLAGADSLIKLTDSTYAFYEPPSYTFISAYNIAFDTTAKLLNSADIYYRVIEHHKRPDEKKLRDSLRILARKYDPDFGRREDEYNDEPIEVHGRYNINDYESAISKAYSCYAINRSINNICEKKYRWQSGFLPEILRIFYYTTLVLTLLLFTFRHTTVKTFFLSLLTGILLLIVTSLFGAFFSIGSFTAEILMVSYYGLFFLLSLLAVNSKTRRWVSGISLNLTVWLTPFIPPIVVSMYYEIIRVGYDRYYDVRYYTRFENEQRYYFYAEIIGFVVLLVLIETLFKFLYRKWYAAPEQ